MVEVKTQAWPMHLSPHLALEANYEAGPAAADALQVHPLWVLRVEARHPHRPFFEYIITVQSMIVLILFSYNFEYLVLVFIRSVVIRPHQFQLFP